MKSIYRSIDNSMHEQPEWREGYDAFDRALKYKLSQQNCRVIPCSNPHSWEDGKEYEEGRDYCIITNTTAGPEKEVYPLPITTKSPLSSNDEDELLTEISDKFRCVAHNYKDGKFDYRTIWKWFQDLKNDYNITKKP